MHYILSLCNQFMLESFDQNQMTISNCEYIKQDGCLYTKDKKTLIIADKSIKTAIVAPGCEIIAQCSFIGSDLTNVSIPNSVKDIGIGCFLQCRSLESINIPSSIENINIATFLQTSLKEITIPKSAKYISYCSFFNCSQLQTVKFENGSNLKEIDDYAFSKTKIESISIPKSVKKIGNCCFAYCLNLFSIDFDQQSDLVEIGKNCFIGTQIKLFRLPQKIQKFDLSLSNTEMISFPQECSFSTISNFECSKIKHISIPSNIDTICFGAFRDCVNLTEVNIIDFKNSKLTHISSAAFYNCKNLSTFKIPEKVKYFGSCSFKNCKKLIVDVELNNKYKEITICESAFEKSGIKSFVSNSNSINVHDYAFKNCKKITRFAAMTNKRCILGSFIFRNNFSLEKFALSQNCGFVSIGQFDFADTHIEIFEVPENLISINDFNTNRDQNNHAILDSTKLVEILNESINFSKLKILFIPFKPKLAYNNESTNNNYCNLSMVEIKNNEIVYVPANVKKLSFLKMVHIKQIEWAPNCIVEDLGPPGFFSYYCLTQIVIPRLVKIIPPRLFEHCHYMKSVEFEKDSLLEEIGDLAFAHTQISKIAFPKSVHKIGSECFIGCANLEIVEFESSNKMKKIPKYCFAFSAIKQIDLPQSIEKIDNSSFIYCQNLKKVNLYETSIAFIGDNAFLDTSIEEIKFPPSLKFIGNNAFSIRNKRLNFIDFTDFNDIIEIKSSSYTTQKQLKNIINAKLLENDKLNHVCFVNNNAFGCTSVKTFRFNLRKKYWLSFFDHCNQIDECILNNDIQYKLHKSTFLNNNMTGINHGISHEIVQMKWLNQDFMPILSNHFLTEIFISKTVKKLFQYNFTNYFELSRVEFEHGINIRSIPKNCFAFTHLKKITIPNSVQIINKSAFFHCAELEEVVFSSESKLKMIKENAFCRCEKLTQINIPQTCNIISKNCFSFSGLKTIEIPSSIKKIEFNTFYNCKDLSCVALNNGLEEICENSFAYNFSLKSIDLPDTLAIIRSRAFYRCYDLLKINTIEKSELVEVHTGAFEMTQIEELSIKQMSKKPF